MKLTNLLLLGALSSNSAQALDIFTKTKQAEVDEVYNGCMRTIQQEKPSEICIENYFQLSTVYGIDPKEGVQDLQRAILDKQRTLCKAQITKGHSECIDDIVILSEKFPLIDYRIPIRQLQDVALDVTFDNCKFKFDERSFSHYERKDCVDKLEILSRLYETDRTSELVFLINLF